MVTLIAVIIFLYPIIATIGWWSQWRKANKQQKALNKTILLLNSIDEKDKKIEYLNNQIQQYKKININTEEVNTNRSQSCYYPINNRKTAISTKEIKSYTTTDLKYSTKEIQDEKDYFVGWIQDGTTYNLILKKRVKEYVDYEPECTFVNKGWKSPELIKENTQCCTLKIGNAYVYMYSPVKGIVYYLGNTKLYENDIILYIESDKEKIFLFEKETIKQALLEKQKKRQLEKQATQELINEGILFSESNKRPPIPKDVADFVWNRDGGKCVYCGSTENLHFDHIIPFSKGGATNVENLQLLCQKCNLEKSNKIG